MPAVTRRSEGTYAIEIPGGPAFLVVSLSWLNALLVALQEEGMIVSGGTRLTRPPR